MKITAKQYAQALFEAVQEKDEQEIKSAIKNFVELLVRNNDVSQVKAIIKEFLLIWNKDRGMVEAQIISARELDKDILGMLQIYLIKKTGSRKLDIKQEIDHNILGGVIIKLGDKILNASLRCYLEELRNKVR